MADEDLMVRFGSAVEGMTAGVEKATHMIEGMVAPVKALQSTFVELGEAILAAFAVERIAEFVEHQAELADQMIRTSAILGVSTDQTQKLGLVASVSGTSTQALAMSMNRLEIGLQRASNPMSVQAKALSALGLSAKELTGLSIDEQVMKMADAFQHLSEKGINPTAAGMMLMGRGAMAMTPLLEQGRHKIEELFETLEHTGGIVKGEYIANLEAMDEQIKIMGDTWTRLKMTIVGEMTPAFQGLIKIITDLIAEMKRSVDEGGLMKTMIDGLAAAIGAVDVALAVAIGAVRTFWEVTKTAVFAIGESFVSLGRVMKDAFTFNWGDISVAWSDLTTKLQARAVIMAANMEHVVKDMVGEIKAALGGIDLPQLPKGDQKAINLNIDSNAIRVAAAELQALIKQAQEAYSVATKLADDQFNQTKEHLGAELKQHQITYDQNSAALMRALDVQFDAQARALDRQYAVESSALAKITALYPAGSAQYQSALNKQEEAHQKYLDKIVEAESKWHGAHQKMVDDAATHDVDTWNKAADQISGAFNSQLRGLLSGTETFKSAMTKMSGDLIIKMIEDQVKLSAEWLAQQGLRLATWVAAETSMTAATTAGAATRAAAETAAGEASILSTLANAIKAIYSSVGQTSAEVTAAVAPVSGPAAPAIGAAAGAASLATALGFVASAEVGGYVVGGGLLNVHAGETVVPAAINQPYQGGGNPVNVTFQVSAMDGPSVASFFRQNAATVARAVVGHINANPSARPAY